MSSQERLEQIDKAMGMFAHLPGSVDDFIIRPFQLAHVFAVIASEAKQSLLKRRQKLRSITQTRLHIAMKKVDGNAIEGH